MFSSYHPPQPNFTGSVEHYGGLTAKQFHERFVIKLEWIDEPLVGHDSMVV
jgi:hypothetical protein